MCKNDYSSTILSLQIHEMIYFQIIKTNNKNYFFLQMVQDSIFSSYDLISEQNLSSTSFKRSLDNLRKKKKKRERSISTTQRFIREFRSDPRRGTSTMSAQDIERESAGSLRKFMVPREIRLGVQ